MLFPGIFRSVFWMRDSGVSARRRSGATRLRTVRRSPQRGGLERPPGENKQDHTARRLQVLRLPTERRRSNSRGSLRIVSGLAENTHSIFCDGPHGPETVNGCPVLRRQETTAERHTCELRVLIASIVRAPPKRESGESFSPLTKDLHGCRQYGSYPQQPASFF